MNCNYFGRNSNKVVTWQKLTVWNGSYNDTHNKCVFDNIILIYTDKMILLTQKSWIEKKTI